MKTGQACKGRQVAQGGRQPASLFSLSGLPVCGASGEANMAINIGKEKFFPPFLLRILNVFGISLQTGTLLSCTTGLSASALRKDYLVSRATKRAAP